MLWSQPPEIEPQKLAMTLSQMVVQKKAMIVKMPALDLPDITAKGGRASTTEGTYALEVSTGPGDGEVIYYLRSTLPRAANGNWLVCRPGQVNFVCSMPSATSGNIILVFARISEPQA